MEEENKIRIAEELKAQKQKEAQLAFWAKQREKFKIVRHEDRWRASRVVRSPYHPELMTGLEMEDWHKNK